MRIFNRVLNIPINSVLIYLPLDEAKQLLASLEALKDNSNGFINFNGKDNNGNLTKELTVRIYSKENLDTFEEKIIKLIETGDLTN
ncbi:MAG: hypothetical protein K8I03_00190 [Ignavibacteria bacterium]|nr:hypothetical protein [Ignavibacteria bacterium]